MQLFDSLIIQPILNALVYLYKGYLSFNTPFAFGFAIITLTVAIRAALHPIFKQQIESQKKMNDMKPKLTELEKLHKDDKTRLQQAQMDLYKEHGMNPASGCLFAIIQIPVFLGLYQVLSKFVTAGADSKVIAEINKMLYSKDLLISKIDPQFFMFNLALAPSHFKIFEFSFKTGFSFFPQNLGYAYYLLVPLITGAMQYYQAKVTMPNIPKKVPQANLISDSKDLTKPEEKKPETFSDEFQSAMNTQMKYFFPVMIGFFSYTLPVGLSLYWNIFSIFSIIQGSNKKKDESLTSSK